MTNSQILDTVISLAALGNYDNVTTYNCSTEKYHIQTIGSTIAIYKGLTRLWGGRSTSHCRRWRQYSSLDGWQVGRLRLSRGRVEEGWMHSSREMMDLSVNSHHVLSLRHHRLSCWGDNVVGP